MMRFATDDTSANVKHRTLCFLYQTYDFIELQVAGFSHGVITTDADCFGENGLRLGLLNIFGKINHDGTRPSGGSDMKRLLNNTWYIGDVRNEKAVLHDRQRHPEEIRLLKSAFTNHGLRDLPSNGDQRCRIHECVRYPCNQVGGTRSTCRHTDSRSA